MRTRGKNKLKDIRLSPNIDVLAFDKKKEEIIGCEVKLLSRKGWTVHNVKDRGARGKIIAKSHRLPKLRGSGLYIGKEKTMSPVATPHEVYEGIGQTVFMQRYVDKAYLVLPNLSGLIFSDVYKVLHLLFNKVLPMGLIEFSPRDDEKLEFKLVAGCAAERTCLYENMDEPLYKVYKGTYPKILLDDIKDEIKRNPELWL